MTFDLRTYQREAIDAVFADWDGGYIRTSLQLPTGAGKTVVFCRLVREARERYGFTGTALVLAHREELVQQAADKFLIDDPELRVGITQAGRNEVVDKDVIVGSVQTLKNLKRLRQLPKIDVVIIDEAHHAAANSYRKILDALGCFSPGGPWVLGVSATLERNDKKRLADIFQNVAYQVDILDLVEAGHLAEPRAKQIDIEGFDLSATHVVAGDLVSEDLAKALEKAGAYGAIAEAYQQYARDRPGIVFCPNIATAEKMSTVLNQWGFKAECITSRTDKDERRDIIDRYQRQDTQILTNCGVLTEGFDAPHTSCIVPKPTMSRIQYSQMVGRGTRLYPGKEDCLVLDLAGVTGRHKLCTPADLTKYEVNGIGEDETLTEAKDRTTREREERAAKTHGSLRARDVDLLRRATGSSIRDGYWLISAGGTPFIKVTDEYDGESFFWIEEIPGFDHVLMWAPDGGQAECLLSRVSYGVAAQQGVSDAMEMTKARAFVDPKARWRRAPFEECSQGQINFAQRLGISMDDRPTKGELSDRITVCSTGLRIDAWIAANRAAV